MTRTGAKTAFLHEERRGGDSNPRYGRIPVRWFSKPLLVNDNGLQGNDLQAAPEKTAQIRADLPEDLQRIIASWNDLPGPVQAAMMALADLRK